MENQLYFELENTQYTPKKSTTICNTATSYVFLGKLKKKVFFDRFKIYNRNETLH
jgi:hypothetical protein